MSNLRQSQLVSRELKEKLVKEKLLSPRDTPIPKLRPEGSSWFISLKIHLQCLLNTRVSPSVERTSSSIPDLSPYISQFYSKVKEFSAPSELSCQHCHLGNPVVDVCLYESSIQEDPVFSIKLCVPADKLGELKHHYQELQQHIKPSKQDSIEMLFNSVNIGGQKKKV